MKFHSLFFYKDSRTKAFSLISLLKSTKDLNAVDLLNQNYTFDEKYQMKITNQEVKVDGIDKILLNGLIQNARVSIVELSKKAGISGAAVHQRLKKLENSSLISGSQININPKILGYNTLAFIGVFLDKAVSNPEAVAQLKKIPEVTECHYTTGNWSILIKILCKDNEHLMNLLNTKIQTISGVSRTETFISLNQQINRQIAL